MIAVTASLALAVPPPQEPAGHPLLRDRTGLEWVLPFEDARAAAEERGRLLLIKPVAFGTTHDGGW